MFGSSAIFQSIVQILRGNERVLKYSELFDGVIWDDEWHEWTAFRPNGQGGFYCVGSYLTKAAAEEAHVKAKARDQWQRENMSELAAQRFGRMTSAVQSKPLLASKRLPIFFEELRFGWVGWLAIIFVAGKLVKLMLTE